jgi:hypothetical protein
MEIGNSFLFNFGVSYSVGGLKRLKAYAKWSNDNGGAYFIIHSSCKGLIDQFPSNRYFLVRQSKYQRILNDTGYLNEIMKTVGRPLLYYSYGVPIYGRVGRINWFHLNNVLPLSYRGIPLSLYDRFRVPWLARRIRDNFRNADVVSAESSNSLGLVAQTHAGQLFLSVNGSDDELALVETGLNGPRENIAVVVGTYAYKALDDSYRVFDMLRGQNSQLKLIIIGEERYIPAALRRNRHVLINGALDRTDVLRYLRQSKYYISTTRVENSYNAASEGLFLADESYISDIPPHRELLRNMNFDRISVPQMNRPVLRIRRENALGADLKSWDTVISEMVEYVNQISPSL